MRIIGKMIAIWVREFWQGIKKERGPILFGTLGILILGGLSYLYEIGIVWPHIVITVVLAALVAIFVVCWSIGSYLNLYDKAKKELEQDG